MKYKLPDNFGGIYLDGERGGDTVRFKLPEGCITFPIGMLTEIAPTPALAPEPPVGSWVVVKDGDDLYPFQNVGPGSAGLAACRWWNFVGDDPWTTWAAIYARGPVARMLPVSVEDSADLPWEFADEAEDTIVLREKVGGEPRAVVEINGGDTAHLDKVAAVRMADALLRWAAVQP